MSGVRPIPLIGGLLLLVAVSAAPLYNDALAAASHKGHSKFKGKGNAGHHGSRPQRPGGYSSYRPQRPSFPHYNKRPPKYQKYGPHSGHHSYKTPGNRHGHGHKNKHGHRYGHGRHGSHSSFSLFYGFGYPFYTAPYVVRPYDYYRAPAPRYAPQRYVYVQPPAPRAQWYDSNPAFAEKYTRSYRSSPDPSKPWYEKYESLRGSATPGD